MALLDRFDNLREDNPAPTSTSWMNPARAIAIVAVVAIHNVSDTVETRFADHLSGAWWLANVIDGSARWAVPVFIMISGALALDPVRGSTPRSFLIKRAYRIGIPLVAWTAIYVWFRLYVLSGRETGWDPLLAIVRGSPFVQLYFLYVLAGLILLTPALRLITLHGNRRLQWGTALIFLGFGMADHIFTSVFEVGELNAATRFLPMVGFYLLGWTMRDFIVRGSRLALTWLVFLASTAGIILLAAFGPGEKPWKFIYEYLSPLVVIAALAAFLLLHAHLRDPVSPQARAFEWLNPLSFGVFLVHALFVFGLRPLIGVPDTAPAVLFHGIVLTIAYTLASALITWIALRIPYLRGIFGAADPPRRKTS